MQNRQAYNGVWVAKFVWAIVTIHQWFHEQKTSKSANGDLDLIWKGKYEIQEIYLKVLNFVKCSTFKSLSTNVSFKLAKIPTYLKIGNFEPNLGSQNRHFLKIVLDGDQKDQNTSTIEVWSQSDPLSALYSKQIFTTQKLEDFENRKLENSNNRIF